jgi:hypothetical protein
VVGSWGRFLVYRVLGWATEVEYGRERLRHVERARLDRRARRLLDEYWKVTEEDPDWYPFCAAPLAVKERARWASCGTRRSWGVAGSNVSGWQARQSVSYSTGRK